MVSTDNLWQALAYEVERRIKEEDLSMDDLNTAGNILWNLNEVNKNSVNIITKEK